MTATARSPGRLVAWLVLVGTFSAISYGVRFTSGKPPKNVLYQYSTAVGGFVQYALVLSLVLAIAQGPSRELFALRRPASWRRAAWLALAVLLAIYALSAALDPVLHAGREQGLTPTRWDPSRAGAYIANTVVIAGIGPVVEELTFRGLGFALLERFGRPATIAAIGLTFGLAHGLVQALPVLVAFGAGLAFLRSRTGSVYPGVLLHTTFNAVALAVAVAT